MDFISNFVRSKENNQIVFFVFVAFLLVAIAGVVFVVVQDNYLRFRDKKRQRIETRIKELFFDFLFQNTDVAKVSDKELKPLLKFRKHNFKLFDNVLVESLNSLKGNYKDRIKDFYYHLDFPRTKLKSLSKFWVSNSNKSRMLEELSSFGCREVIPLLDTNSQNHNFRLFSIISKINLLGFEAFEIFSNFRYTLSHYEQILILEKLANINQNIIPNPDFLLKSSNDSNVLLGLRYLERFFYPDNFEYVITLLNHPNSEVQIQALQVIQTFQYKEAKSAVLDLFNSSVFSVQLKAVACLFTIMEKDDTYLIEEICRKHKNPIIRKEMYSGFLKLDPTYRIFNLDFDRSIAILDDD